MKRKVAGLSQSINKKIKAGCDRIPENKRKFIVMVLCFLFISIFGVMLQDSFHSNGVQKMMKIKHITPLDLPQDTLINHFKNKTNGYN